MTDKTITITSLEDLREQENRLNESAQRTVKDLKKKLNKPKSSEIFYSMKFDHSGHDPLDKKRSLNLIEQLNQHFTYLVSFKATAQLLREFPDKSFTMHLGTSRGPDIISEDSSVVAEVFAAVNPRNNDKLKKDVERVSQYKSSQKFVFYHSPKKHVNEDALTEGFPDVKIMFIKEKELQKRL